MLGDFGEHFLANVLGIRGQRCVQADESLNERPVNRDESRPVVVLRLLLQTT
jgi:hypothetical protein